MRKRRLPRSSPNGRILPSSRTSHWMHRHRVFCEWVLFTVLCFSPAGTTAGVAASTDSFPALLPPLTAGATAANFPPHPSSPWYDVNMGTSSDSDGDNELESSSDFEEVELGASSLSGLNNSATTDTRFGTNRNNHSNRPRSHPHPRKDLEQSSTESFEHGNSLLKNCSTNRRNRPSLLNQNDELAAPGNDKKYPASRVGTKQIETSGSQPLQTLQKLQQMLDETGYMTSKPRKSETGPQQFAQASTAVSVHEKTTSTSKNAFTDSRSLPNVVEHKVDVKAEALAISTAAASLRSTVSASQSDLNPLTTKSPVPEPTEKLWTSQDRSKYKRQQYLLRKARAEQEDLQHRNTRLSSEPNIPPPPPPRMTSTVPQHFSYYQQTNRYRQAPHFQPAVSEDEENAYTDDGLGYTLPNLPVYYSDNEGESEEVAEEFAKSTTIQELPWQQFPAESSSMQSTIANPHSAVFRPPQYVRTLPHDYLSQQQPYIQQQNNHHHHQQQQQPYTGYNSNHHVPYTPHRYPYQYSTYGYGPPPQQGYTATQGAYKGLYGPQWVQSNHPNYGNYPGTHSSPPQHSQSHFESPPQILKEVPNTGNARMASSTINPSKAGHQLSALAMPKQSATVLTTSVGTHPMETSQLGFGTSQSLAEASARISFDAIQQISFMMMMTALLCYSAVSPRTLPLTEYNLRFYENIQSVSLSAVVPIISMVSVFDARENDVNRIVNTFFFSFTLGYTMAFAGEVVMATVVRLLTFFWFEPNIFSLTPMVPVPILPWVLRECKYRPKRITLLAADFGTSCVAAPFIEEYMKLKIVQWFVDLPRYASDLSKSCSLLRMLIFKILFAPRVETSIGPLAYRREAKRGGGLRKRLSEVLQSETSFQQTNTSRTCWLPVWG
jgi:hypothetical protein